LLIATTWSGVALAMRHRLSGLSTYGLKGQCAGDEHPTYAPLVYGSPLPRGKSHYNVRIVQHPQ